MQEFATKRGASHLSRRGALVAALAVLVIGSAGFAAAGGLEMIKGWFVTVTVQVDGETIAVENVTTDEEGRATIPLPDGALEDGQELSITISGEGPVAEPAVGKTVTGYLWLLKSLPDPVADPAVGKTVTVDISAEDNNLEVQVKTEDEGEEVQHSPTP